MPVLLQSLEDIGDALGRGRRIESNQTNGRPRSENRDHDRVVIDRVHEHVTAVPLVIERVEFHFADAARELRVAANDPAASAAMIVTSMTS